MAFAGSSVVLGLSLGSLTRSPSSAPHRGDCLSSEDLDGRSREAGEAKIVRQKSLGSGFDRGPEVERVHLLESMSRPNKRCVVEHGSRDDAVLSGDGVSNQIFAGSGQLEKCLENFRRRMAKKQASMRFDLLDDPS
jgi:hypothetical protein